MRHVKPQVFLVGQPQVDRDELQRYLDAVGAPDWETDSPTDLGTLTEVAGRSCYRSFKPKLNPNVVKVREGHKTYIDNIMKVKHGSVIEHGQLTFVFLNVSRVFTHELVRHRPGTAISQESLRFVRLVDLPFWFPEWAHDDEELMERCLQVIKFLEQHQKWMAKHFGLDEEGLKFHVKKEKTSFMRRFAPEGVGTAIVWSVNTRTLRWVLQARTDAGAEEEIRLVFNLVGEIVQERFAPFYDDFEKVPVDGSDVPAWVPKNEKV